MALTDLSEIRMIMERHGIAPQKKFGQNFLVVPSVVARIADTPGDSSIGIIEIGPGIGTLTEQLAPRYRKVVALEIDTGLEPVLADTLHAFDNVKVVFGDAMKTNLRELVASEFDGGRVAVCANLPYYITSPMILFLLENGSLFDSITVMIQKEVADRLCAAPGTAEYGAITLAVQYACTVEKCFSVSPGSFFPPPKVTSTVIKMTPHEKPPVSVRDKDNMFRMIRAAFDFRRKTLVNALSTCTPKSKEEITSAIVSCGFSADVRGERLSLADFAALSNVFTL